MAAIRSEQVKLAYDMSTVAALQDDVAEISNSAAQTTFQSKIITLNEARAAVGYPARDDGDDTFFSKRPAGGAMPASRRRKRKRGQSRARRRKRP